MSEKLRPFRPITPGEILQEEIDARGWSQSDLAEILGRPVQAINEIIRGKKAIVAATARELARAFGTSSEFWLNLESAYRLDLLKEKGDDDDQIARRAKVYSLVPVKELMKRGWIRQTTDLGTIERDVCKLLEIKSVDERPKLAVAARKSNGQDGFSSGQLAWLCRVRQLARRHKVKPFDRRRFKAEVSALLRLSADEDVLRGVTKALAKLGIRMVVAEHLPKTYIDGAAFWLDAKSPAVALSLRYDRIDYFWFTLMHELAHIHQDTHRVGHLDSNLVGPSAEACADKERSEQEADRRASEWLIPQDAVDSFIAETRPYYSKSAITAFAKCMSIHPGIVVGRLQYLGEIPYSHSRGMLGKARG